MSQQPIIIYKGSNWCAEYSDPCNHNQRTVSGKGPLLETFPLGRRNVDVAQYHKKLRIPTKLPSKTDIQSWYIPRQVVCNEHDLRPITKVPKHADKRKIGEEMRRTLSYIHTTYTGIIAPAYP